MNASIAAAALAAATLPLAGAAFAETAPMPRPEITQRDAAGHATKVRIDGQEYAVCTMKGQDGCINPREAGLKWGNVPLDYWPGQPASEMKN